MSAVDFPENSTADVGSYGASDPEGATTTLSLGGTDAASFTLTGGALKFNSAPDYENKNSYSVSFTASDGTNEATLGVTVSITDVAEAMTLSGLENLSIAENATDLSLGTYMAEDADGRTIVWSLEGADAAMFTLSGGALSLKSSPDYETKSSYSVTVKATAGTKSRTLAVTVTVTDANEPLTFTGGTTTPSYAENGTGVVETYTASDPENAAIAWTVEGTDASAFDISGGDLTFKSSPDYETKNSYSITVKAQAGIHVVTRAVTVTVTNVDEPPTINGGTTTPSFAENGTGVVETYAASDPENDAIAWSVEGADASAFSIGVSDGILTFNSPPDYENKNSYSITVRVTAGGKSSAVDVTVTVTDANEPLTFTGGATTPSYAENGTGVVETYTASDPENAAISWTVEGTDASVIRHQRRSAELQVAAGLRNQEFILDHREGAGGLPCRHPRGDGDGDQR